MPCWRCTAARKSESDLDRAWSLLRSWQLPDGSFRPSGQVQEGTWVTAHAVTLATVRGVDDARVRSSVDWLLQVVGARARHRDAGRLVLPSHPNET